MNVKQLLLAGLVLVMAVLLVQGCRGARTEAALFSPPRLPIRVPVALQGVPLLEIAFGGEDGAGIRGWYLASRSGAAVVLAHGSGADRSQLATEARLLYDRGFGVLAFDWPGHGESAGKVTYGPGERAALRAAVSFLASQPGVDARRIGALGFSIGAALLAVTAPEEPRLRSIALVSCFADSDEEAVSQFEKWRPVMGPAALLVDRWYMPEAPMRPVDAVRKLTATDVLVVAFSRDPVVPSWMSEKVFEAISGPKEWVLVPHDRHGSIDALAPGPYGEAIRRFFERTLGP
jgi:pimeloyl-ACP methyl ester carboxylesterase